jgi:Ca-activated chloride channel family protein
MRKVVLVLLMGLWGFTLVSNSARADGMILPETLTPDYLAVRYHRVTVTIKDNHAVTQVEQEFYNPHPFPVEGRYTFPVPPEAMVSEFRAEVDGQPQAVTRQDAATTNAALYDIVAQRRDPSLLQYADWDSLAFDLTLPAGDSRQMTLAYEEVLAPSGGMFHYRYILSTERYSSQPLEEVSITVELASSKGLGSLYSSSHPVTTERLGSGRARISWQAAGVRPSEDFDLFFAPAEGGFGGGLLTGRRENQDHFLFLFAPEAEAVQDEALPKDIVFVIDRSGSMAGEKIEQARNALQFILGQLNPSDRFSMIGFDDHLTSLSPTLQPVDKQSLAEARQFVTGLTAAGDTDLEAALQAGLVILAESEARPEATRLVIFLTDGLPTAGITDDGLIANLVSRTNTQLEARLHVFGVGYDVNTHLLDRLAKDNGGSVTYVQPGENLELVLTGFYDRIARPVLTDLTVTFEGMVVSEVQPQPLPDLFQGSSLLLTGRYQATDSPVTVRIKGRAGEQERSYSYSFDLAQSGDYDFVPRLWATRQLGQLLDQVRVEGQSAALVEEIRSLGLGYGLVTPYTTFVIEAQSEGAASTANMALYDNQTALNQVSGQTTIQARVQNQMYQQASQANLASGANIVNQGQHSLAQVADQQVDLSLLQAQGNVDGPITAAWLARNVKIDRQVKFGSEEYFALAANPALRPYLQSGPNVLFAFQGKVIAVWDDPAEDSEAQELGRPATGQTLRLDLYSRVQDLFRLLGQLTE